MLLLFYVHCPENKLDQKLPQIVEGHLLQQKKTPIGSLF